MVHWSVIPLRYLTLTLTLHLDNSLQFAVSAQFSVFWGTTLFYTHIIDAHAIYLLNLLLAFLQPKLDPSLQDDLMADELEGGESDAPSPLPSTRDDEFRPFVRRLPEWQFWYPLSPMCLQQQLTAATYAGYPPPARH